MKKTMAGCIKKWTVTLLLISFAGTLWGCGNSAIKGEYTYSNGSNAGFDNMKYEMSMEESAMDMDNNLSDKATAIQENDVQDENVARKLVYRANLDMETRDYDASVLALRKAVEAENGYMESSSQYGSAENGNRHYYVTVRVPAERYRAFLDRTGNIGSVVSISESMEDVTTQYIDVQARMDSLNEQRNRLLELLKKAERLEDMLAIESRLSDVQYQLESYTGKMMYLQQQVSYSTVDVELYEVVEYTPANTFTARLKRAMTGTWSDFFYAMGELLIGLIYILPYLMVLFVAGWIIKKVWKNSRRKKAEKMIAEQQELMK